MAIAVAKNTQGNGVAQTPRHVRQCSVFACAPTNGTSALPHMPTPPAWVSRVATNNSAIFTAPQPSFNPYSRDPKHRRLILIHVIQKTVVYGCTHGIPRRSSDYGASSFKPRSASRTRRVREGKKYQNRSYHTKPNNIPVPNKSERAAITRPRCSNHQNKSPNGHECTNERTTNARRNWDLD